MENHDELSENHRLWLIQLHTRCIYLFQDLLSPMFFTFRLQGCRHLLRNSSPSIFCPVLCMNKLQWECVTRFHVTKRISLKRAYRMLVWMCLLIPRLHLTMKFVKVVAYSNNGEPRLIKHISERIQICSSFPQELMRCHQSWQYTI